jgi:ATP-dependent exoDNAse (exonuclease V) beta subunit
MDIKYGKFIVCKASAGSGKTFKLVSDYISLCLTSDSSFTFSRILAITFTNKAAGEMKERIIEHLRALSSNTNETFYHPEWLKHYREKTGLNAEQIKEKSEKIFSNILHHYTSLSISTIDKFTYKLIRSFARDLRIAADFEIKPESDETLDKSTDELVSMAGMNDEVTEILLNYTEFLSDEGENWNPEKSIRKFSSQLLDEDFSPKLKEIGKLNYEQFKETIKIATEKIKIYESDLNKLNTAFQDILNKTELTSNDFKYKRNSICRHFEKIKNKEYSDPKLFFGKQDSECRLSNTYIHKDSAQKVSPATDEEITTICNKLDDYLLNNRKNYLFFILLRKNIFVLSLISKLSSKITEITSSENSILIAEFNQIISDVVKNDPAPFIYERIGERYDHILIDEFQDTSTLQFQNLLPLITNSLAANHTCMVVGDPKQAIYRWRGGDINQFIQLPESEGEENELLKLKFLSEKLDHNYRSGKIITEFNNEFFITASELLQEEYKAIYKNAAQIPVHDGGYAELMLVADSTPDPIDFILQNSCDKINECINDGFNWSDIAVITRNKKEGKLLAEIFTKKNIPVISNESLLLHSSNEVSLIMNFIKLLAYPNDRNASFKVIELFCKIKNKTLPDDLYLNKFKNCFPAREFLEKEGIYFDRNQLIQFTAYKLAQKSVQLLLPETNSIYIRYLIEYIFNYWKNNPTDATALCRWWEENYDSLSIQSNSQNNAVQLLTIHASKGLQFPVVIFPFASWKQKNGKSWILLDLSEKQLPIPATLVKSDASVLDNTDYNTNKQSEKSKTMLDDFNLLYVAFTRAERRLYILAEEINTMKTFAPYLKNTLEEKSSGLYAKGSKEIYTSKIQSIQNAMPVEVHLISDADSKLTLSLNNSNSSDENEQNYNLKKQGVFLHRIFEKYNSEEDALKILETESNIDPVIFDAKDKLKTEIQNVYRNPFLSELFSGTDTFNEISIVDETGTSYRPDKVVIENKNVIICDFKTGKQNEKHKDQLMEYGKLFEQMNYNTVKKYLFYTSESILTEI